MLYTDEGQIKEFYPIKTSSQKSRWIAQSLQISQRELWLLQQQERKASRSGDGEGPS